MRLRALVATVAVFGVVFGTAFAGQNFTSASRKASPVTVEPPLSSPVIGEKLVFDVRWLGIPVGVGTLEVRGRTEVRGRPAIHYVAEARTNDFLSRLYPVRDEVHSFVDVENHRVLHFSKKLTEGRYRADEEIAYDYARKKGIYRSHLNGSVKQMDLDGDWAVDILGCFYWFRLQRVEGPGAQHVAVHSDEKNWDVELKVLGFESKELRGRGVFQTMVVEPRTRLKGVLHQRGRAYVNFTTDSRRLPVWITLKTPFGPVVGVLRGKARNQIPVARNQKEQR